MQVWNHAVKCMLSILLLIGMIPGLWWGNWSENLPMYFSFALSVLFSFDGIAPWWASFVFSFNMMVSHGEAMQLHEDFVYWSCLFNLSFSLFSPWAVIRDRGLQSVKCWWRPFLMCSPLLCSICWCLIAAQFQWQLAEYPLLFHVFRRF